MGSIVVLDNNILANQNLLKIYIFIVNNIGWSSILPPEFSLFA